MAGPQVPEADVAGTPLDAWRTLCDYAEYDVTNFIGQMSDTAVWLFDRGTTAYRGYARRGDLLTLETAYRETAIYRAGITGTGAATRIPIAPDDAKYHYTQNMAIHYLLSGDDRFREAAEAVGRRTAVVWPSPGYAGGEDFWTERSAGFGLLAFVWAMIVSDDAAAEFRGLADAAVTAHLEDQEMYPVGYADTQARCFAHSAEAHSEGFGYWGCSPWMSAILADGLDAYATERGGAQAAAARASLVKLARAIARDGLRSVGQAVLLDGRRRRPGRGRRLRRALGRAGVRGGAGLAPRAAATTARSRRWRAGWWRAWPQTAARPTCAASTGSVVRRSPRRFICSSL